MLKFTVRGQNIFCDCGFIVSDSVDYLTAFFDFSHDWAGLVKTAQFKQNDTVYSVLVSDDRCFVPTEITSGELEISVFGVQSGGTRRITTAQCSVTVCPSGYCDDGQTPLPPTPDLYSQLLSELESTLEKAQENCPEKLSELENDTEYITGEALPKKLSELENDSKFITEEDIPDVDVPTKMSELEQDLPSLTIGNTYISSRNISNNDQGGEMRYGGFFTKVEGQTVTINGTKSTTIKNVVTPTNDTDAVNKKYVDSKKLSDFTNDLNSLLIANFLILSSSGINANGTLNITAREGVAISNLKSPSADTDAANKKYVDDITGDISAALDSILALQQQYLGVSE